MDGADSPPSPVDLSDNDTEFADDEPELDLDALCAFRSSSDADIFEEDSSGDDDDKCSKDGSSSSQEDEQEQDELMVRM